MNTHHTVDYWEIPTTDLAAAKAFYAAAFGWTFEDWGPDYVAVHGAGLEGGLARVDAPPPRGGPIIILYSDDLESSEAAVASAGGTIVAHYDFPGGRRFHFLDPSGAELAIWTPSKAGD